MAMTIEHIYEKCGDYLYADNMDRVEVERLFSFAKRCYRLGKIMIKLDITTRSSIALSILVMNVARIMVLFCTNF